MLVDGFSQFELERLADLAAQESKRRRYVASMLHTTESESYVFRSDAELLERLSSRLREQRV